MLADPSDSMPGVDPATGVAVDAAEPCLNCAVVGSGSYCAHCGQSRALGRLSMPAVARAALAALVALDRPFLNTAIGLTLRPGRVVAEYLAGRRRRYTNPIQYCAVATALAILAINLSGRGSLPKSAATIDQAAPAMAASADAMQRILPYMQLLNLLLLPLLAVFTLLLLRGARRTYAEHLAWVLFAYGQAYLLQAGCVPWGWMEHPVAGSVLGCAPFVWLSWSAVGFDTRGGWVRPVAASLAAHLLFYLVFIGVAAVLMA